MIDKKRVEPEAKNLPLKIGLRIGKLARKAKTPQGLKEAFDQLIEELQAIAESSTPRRKPNRGFQAPWWSPEIRDLHRKAREAERTYRAVTTPEARSELNRASKALSKAIQASKTAK